MNFSKEQIKQLRDEYKAVSNKYSRIVLKCNDLATRLAKPKSKEYLSHGFMRRFGIMKRCIDNVYRIYPPDKVDLLTKTEREDAEINLQAFIFNVYGALENLSRVFSIEMKETKIKDIKEFGKYLDKDAHNRWRGYLEDFRHSLAHRIPLYIPPQALNKEESERYRNLCKQMSEAFSKLDFVEYERLYKELSALGSNCPLMVHSFSEKSQEVFFHSQVLADFNTIVEFTDILINRMLKEENS